MIHGTEVTICLFPFFFNFTEILIWKDQDFPVLNYITIAFI